MEYEEFVELAKNSNLETNPSRDMLFDYNLGYDKEGEKIGTFAYNEGDLRKTYISATTIVYTNQEGEVLLTVVSQDYSDRLPTGQLLFKEFDKFLENNFSNISLEQYKELSKHLKSNFYIFNTYDGEVEKRFYTITLKSIYDVVILEKY